MLRTGGSCPPEISSEQFDIDKLKNSQNYQLTGDSLEHIDTPYKIMIMNDKYYIHLSKTSGYIELQPFLRFKGLNSFRVNSIISYLDIQKTRIRDKISHQLIHKTQD
jgi:hypothetical protein